MKLSQVANEVETWLGASTYAYEITEVYQKAEGEWRIHFIEYTPTGEDDESFFTILGNGIILNSDGKDVIETALNAYSNDAEAVLELNSFKDRWYAINTGGED